MRAEVAQGAGVTHHDFLLLGFFLAGGAETYVDIEHVAVKLFELAPTQFSWRLYPQYPSLEAVQRAIGNGRIRHGYRYVRRPQSSKSTERMLTAEGIARAVAVAEQLVGRSFDSPQAALAALNALGPNPPDVGGSASITADNRPVHRELRALRKHDLFRGWQANPSLDGAELWQLADLLNCLPDSTDEVWRERLGRLQAQAEMWRGDPIVKFIAAISHVVEHQLDARKGRK